MARKHEHKKYPIGLHGLAFGINTPNILGCVNIFFGKEGPMKMTNYQTILSAETLSRMSGHYMAVKLDVHL
jgi:hypothetical protein